MMNKSLPNFRQSYLLGQCSVSIIGNCLMDILHLCHLKIARPLVVGKRAEEAEERGSGGGGELKRLVCRLDGRTDGRGRRTRARELMKLQLLPRRESEPRIRRSRGTETPTKMFCDTSRSINNSTDRGREERCSVFPVPGRLSRLLPTEKRGSAVVPRTHERTHAAPRIST